MPTYFINSRDGDDTTGTGLTETQAWKTLKHAFLQNDTTGNALIKPGDAVILKGGRAGNPYIYYESYIDVRFDDDGSENPISITSDNGNAVIDSRYRWRHQGKEWLPFDLDKGIYQMTITADDLKHYDDEGDRDEVKLAKRITTTLWAGSFIIKGKRYSLIPYKSYSHFAEEKGFYKDDGYYAGPGIFANEVHEIIEGKKRLIGLTLFIRLTPLDKSVVRKLENTFVLDDSTHLNPNDNEVDVHISTTLATLKNSNNFLYSNFLSFRNANVRLSIENLSFKNQTSLFIQTLREDSFFSLLILSDLNIYGDCVIKAPGSNFHIDSIEKDGYFPPWVSFNDSKSGVAVTSPLTKRHIETINKNQNVTIVNSSFKNSFDAIFLSASYNARDTTVRAQSDNVSILNCTFENIIDDAITLVWSVKDVVISGNTFKNVFAGVTRNGGGGKKGENLHKKEINIEFVGRVHICDNLFILNAHGFRPADIGITRIKTDYGTSSAFNGTHSSESIGISNWKIYHNTVIDNRTLTKATSPVAPSVALVNRNDDRKFYPEERANIESSRKYRQEVYNNIFIAIGKVFLLDIPTSREEFFEIIQILNGNIYYNVTHNPPAFRIMTSNLESLEGFPSGWETEDANSALGGPSLDANFRAIPNGLAYRSGVSTGDLRLPFFNYEVMDNGQITILEYFENRPYKGIKID